MNNYTSYPSGFLVVDPAGIYSKHYYLGSQRIASRIGDGTAAIFEGKAVDMSGLKTLQQRDLQYFAAKAGHTDVSYAAYTPATLNDIADEDGSKAETPIAIYYYHPDHLGSNTFITDISGKPYQLFLNLPFGESMAEQSSLGYFQSPYKFNGKELDKETGLYYYGARFYDPRTSLWLSVDPKVEKYPNLTPYNYCADNPVFFTDPDGTTIVYSGAMNSKQLRLLITANILASQHSEIFHSIYKELYSANETYTFGRNFKDPHEYANFTQKGNNLFENLMTGNDFYGQINVNWDLVQGDINVLANASAEEVFHAGQSRFNNKMNFKGYADGDLGELTKEIEVRAFRAYAGLYDENEYGMAEFAAASGDYFAALREGDKAGMKKNETSFRSALGKLAETITRSGHPYSNLGGATIQYNESCNTPLFDKLTKDDGKKN